MKGDNLVERVMESIKVLNKKEEEIKQFTQHSKSSQQETKIDNHKNQQNKEKLQQKIGNISHT